MSTSQKFDEHYAPLHEAFRLKLEAKGYQHGAVFSDGALPATADPLAGLGGPKTHPHCKP